MYYDMTEYSQLKFSVESSKRKLSHIKKWSVCKKFHKCEFCENQETSPGVGHRLADRDTLSREGVNKKPPIRVETCRTRENQRGGFPDDWRGTTKKKKERFEE